MLWNQEGFDEIRSFGTMEGYFLHYVLSAEVILPFQLRRIFRWRMPRSYVEEAIQKKQFVAAIIWLILLYYLITTMA